MVLTVPRLLRPIRQTWSVPKTSLVDLRQTNEHATQIIEGLKKLLKRNEPQQQEFDVNEAIAEAMRLLSPSRDALLRRVGAKPQWRRFHQTLTTGSGPAPGAG